MYEEVRCKKSRGVRMPIYLKSKTNLSNRLLRAGTRVDDTSICYRNHAKTKAELGWKAKYGIEEIILF